MTLQLLLYWLAMICIQHTTVYTPD
ncbi:hypothetical protein MNBD_CHLOROFLEXI01-4761, partial [hydrothermal vent metagenome]